MSVLAEHLQLLTEAARPDVFLLLLRDDHSGGLGLEHLDGDLAAARLQLAAVHGAKRALVELAALREATGGRVQLCQREHLRVQRALALLLGGGRCQRCRCCNFGVGGGGGRR